MGTCQLSAIIGHMGVRLHVHGGEKETPGW